MAPGPGSPHPTHPGAPGATVARHSLLYLFARGLPALVNLLAMALYTRLLAPDDYGRYALVIAGVSLAQTVLFQWLRLSVLRFLPAHDDRPETFLPTVVAGYAGLVCVSALLGAVALFLLPDSVSRGLVALGCLLLWVQAFYELNLGMTTMRLTPGRYGLLAMVKSVGALAIGGFLAWLGFGAEGLLAGLAAGMLLASVLQLGTWKSVRGGSVERGLFRKFLEYGLPLSATFVLAFVVSGSDRFLVGWFMGSGFTGRYAAGYDLASQSLGVVLMVVNLAAYPLAVRALERDGEPAAREQLARNFVLLLAVGVPGAVGLAMLAPGFSRLFLGEEFRATAEVLVPLIALGALLAGLRSYYFDLSFQLGRRTIGQVWVTLAAALLNVGLNLAWIPRQGLVGAAWATVVAYAGALGMSWLLGRRIFPVPLPAGQALRIAIATAGMAAVLWVLPDRTGTVSLLARVSTAGLAYGSLLVGLNVANLRVRAMGRLRGLG